MLLMGGCLVPAVKLCIVLNYSVHCLNYSKQYLLCAVVLTLCI